jgi:hypothetical protein
MNTILAMNTIAAGAGVHWNGSHGWLIAFACLAFVFAILASLGKMGRYSGYAILFIAVGLLLWAVTGIWTG